MFRNTLAKHYTVACVLMAAGSFIKKTGTGYAKKFPTFEEGKGLTLNNENAKYVYFGNKLSGDAPCVSFHRL